MAADRYKLSRKFFSVGGDYTVADAAGATVLAIDGKVRFGAVFSVQAPDGRELFTGREHVISLDHKFEIERDGVVEATLLREIVSGGNKPRQGRGADHQGGRTNVPNGNDRNWVRVSAALDGFFMRCGHWPKRVRLHEYTLKDLEHLFLPDSWRRLTATLQFIRDDEAQIVAEDDDGNTYDYGAEGFPPERPQRGAEQWLGVAPDAAGAYDN